MKRMLSLSLLFVACLGLAGVAVAKEKKGKKRDAFAQLQAIPAEVDAQLQSVTAPIDQVDVMLAQMKTLPKQLDMSEGDFAEVINGALSSQTLVIPETVQGKQREELTAFVQNFSTFRTNLFATPSRAQTMTTELASTSAQIPVLATKASADAGKTLINPLASKKDKDKAKKRQEDVKKIQADAQQAVADAQTKVVGVPGRATEATAKLITGAGQMGITENALRAAQQPVDDAKQGVRDTADTARDGAKKTVDDTVGE